jgi:membrane protein
MNKPAVRDGALFVLRLVLGFVFIAHGWQILFADGAAATAQIFAAAGVPQAQMSAWVAGVSQLVGGSMLIVGLLTTAVAGALALLVLAAAYFVHFDHGVFVANNGFEYVLVLMASLMMIVVFGSGRASLDAVLG